MTIQKVNIGSVVNDGTGDDLRTAFVKANNNFDELDNIIKISKSNEFIVKHMSDVLTNYDFGSFVGATSTNTGILQLILQSLDIEFGTITSPGKYDLDLGSIIVEGEQPFLRDYVNNLDGGSA
jgi:hypothetical protein